MKYFILAFLFCLSVFTLTARIQSGRIEAQYNSGTSTYLVRITTYSKTSSFNSDRSFLDSVHLGYNNIVISVNRIAKINYPGDISLNKYEFLHTFPGPGNYLIHYSDLNSYSFVNIPNSSPTVFYLETELVIPIGNCIANTPQIFMDPVFVFPCNRNVNIARTAFDFERDSLAYTLVSCKVDPVNTILGYYLPAGVSLNPVTGEFKWNGNSIADTGEFFFAVKIEKWRRAPASVMIPLGYVMEEFSLNIKPNLSTNFNFDTSGYPVNAGGYFSSTVLPDSVFNLHIEFIDSSISPTLGYISNMIDSSTWATQTTGNLVTADFSWTPSAANISRQPYSLIIRGQAEGIDLVYSVYVEGVYSDSCMATIGINEISDEQNILIYPNPASGNIHISLNDTQENFSFCIFDMKGQFIYSANKVQSPFLIPIDKLSAGMFMVRVENKKGVFNRKLVVY